MNISNAPIYYANNILKFISIGAGKFTTDDDGFDGVTTKIELLKSRTNKAGQFCNLVYDQVRGFDPIRSLYLFAKENDMIGGRNPYQFIEGSKDIKFSSKVFVDEFKKNPALRTALYDVTIPILNKQLSHVDNDSTQDVASYLNGLYDLAKAINS